MAGKPNIPDVFNLDIKEEMRKNLVTQRVVAQELGEYDSNFSARLSRSELSAMDKDRVRQAIKQVRERIKKFYEDI